MLKLLLLRNGKDDKHIHGLVGLYLALPKKVHESLSATERDSLQGIQYGLFAVREKSRKSSVSRTDQSPLYGKRLNILTRT